MKSAEDKPRGVISLPLTRKTPPGSRLTNSRSRKSTSGRVSLFPGHGHRVERGPPTQELLKIPGENARVFFFSLFPPLFVFVASFLSLVEILKFARISVVCFSAQGYVSRFFFLFFFFGVCMCLCV